MGPVLYEHGLELHPDHKLRFRLSAQVIAISQVIALSFNIYFKRIARRSLIPGIVWTSEITFG